MRKIRFDSPYQVEAEAAEHGVTLRRGEVQEVEDDVAEALLKHPYVTEVPSTQPKPTPSALAVLPDKPATP